MPSFDERAFIAEVEAANPDDFARLLLRPSLDQERALRQYFGDARYERLHGRTLARNRARGACRPIGNVVVLHGIMGGELAATRQADNELIWVKVWRLIAGSFDRLRLRPDGRAGYEPGWDVRAVGMLKRYYGDILIALGARWKVQAFWYDWRKDLNLAAADLAAKIVEWFPDGGPVHLVAHSMGGLVARTFILNHDQLWRRMAGGRLVMLGTPNHGAFVVPQVIAGIEPLVRKLALVDLHHGVKDVCSIIASFPGLLQMLPSPIAVPSMQPLYDASTYGLDIWREHLEAAARQHVALQNVVDPDRMIYVAGCNQLTLAGLRDPSKFRDEGAYLWTRDGDGRVTHDLGLLRTANGRDVPTYYVEAEHGSLPMNDAVLTALDDLLKDGRTSSLGTTIPRRARGRVTRADLHALHERAANEEQELTELTRRMRARSRVGEVERTYLAPEERLSEDIVVRGFLGGSPSSARPAPGSMTARPQTMVSVQVDVQLGSIDGAHELGGRRLPVDAVAVGHYLGVRPQAAELALDRAISAVLPGRRATVSSRDVGTADLLLTQYTDRGVLRGELGTPFLLPDPRQRVGRRRSPERVLAVAGLGVPARFGSPELVVLVRELAWALGRLGKQHLATVLIGSGNGNLPVRAAVQAWVRGLRYALTGSSSDTRRRLQRITFVEFDPHRVAEIDRALADEQRDHDDGAPFTLRYAPLTPEQTKRLNRQAIAWDRKQEKARRSAEASPRTDPPPTRITLTFEHDKYRYGALTETASVPEREIDLDSTLVGEINESLVTVTDVKQQEWHGGNLGRFMFPADFRERLRGNAPLVMLLDTKAAAIHWELVTRPDLDAPPGTPLPASPIATDEFDRFFGTAGGLTRQLRTAFAPPPEPPPPPRRTLRVLIVADPAAEAHLPGAEEEGIAVAELFERFNAAAQGRHENRAEVVRLFGPSEATRARVLEELMGSAWDVLHFAGHCFYDETNPPASGWIFSGGKTLSARELNRIDRIPKFVFSNACESGITPDRSELRNATLAPSFAEAFFARGVANFVCTAWPVDDMAARAFARRLYGGLLGLDVEGTPANTADVEPPEAMHEAMREARRVVGKLAYGVRTWGAYQHYGNPFFRFFEADIGRTPGRRHAATPRRGRPRQRRRG
ncbi:MAG TPA: CHAT domain-containing protein [Candidatus Binatia bacterium]|jgi:pimeloyl-ACP methyl ester carboxylesterase|nr:CHAT domain-containing protein [Candidatus Binatia bacterium]